MWPADPGIKSPVLEYVSVTAMSKMICQYTCVLCIHVCINTVTINWLLLLHSFVLVDSVDSTKSGLQEVDLDQQEESNTDLNPHSPDKEWKFI